MLYSLMMKINIILNLFYSDLNMYHIRYHSHLLPHVCRMFALVISLLPLHLWRAGEGVSFRG